MMDQDFREKVISGIATLNANQQNILDNQKTYATDLKAIQVKAEKIPLIEAKTNNNRKLFWLILVIYLPLIATLAWGGK